MPEVIITTVIFTIETCTRLFSSLRRRNPQILREQYYENKKHKLRDLQLQKDKAPNPDFFAASIKPKLEAVARRYILRANLAWGRDLISRYKAAWCNVLTAECYEIAEDRRQAGRYFHFAAHSFRELGEFEIAGDYYRKSAECLEREQDHQFAARSCRRAIASYMEVQEDGKADQLRTFLTKLMAADIQHPTSKK